MISDVIAVSQALLTPVIAVATTYIAYQQYRIRRDEKSLALYDRRLALYKAAIKIVDQVRTGQELIVDDAFEWLNSTAEIEFLFGEEVQVVTDGLFGAVYSYAMLTEPVRLGGAQFNTECADAMGVVENFRTPLQRAFAPYLRPAGSPQRRKKRLTVKAAEELVIQADPGSLIPQARTGGSKFNENEDDIPF